MLVTLRFNVHATDVGKRTNMPCVSSFLLLTNCGQRCHSLLQAKCRGQVTIDDARGYTCDCPSGELTSLLPIVTGLAGVLDWIPSLSMSKY